MRSRRYIRFPTLRAAVASLPQHLAGVLVGAPAKFTISDSANLRTGALRSFNHMLTQWCPGVWGGLITGVLKPDPEEYARKALSYRTRSQFAKPSKIW